MPYSLEEEPGKKLTISGPKRIINQTGVEMIHVFPSRNKQIFVDVCNPEFEILTDTGQMIINIGTVKGEGFKVISKQTGEVEETILFEAK